MRNNPTLAAQKYPLVTIEACKSTVDRVAVLNDLSAQFYDISSRVSEIEAQLEDLRVVLLSLIASV